MIDTDKYEGHTEGPWEAPHEILVSGLNHIGPLSNGQEEVNEVDAKLIADAPLILEAYKRLRKVLEDIRIDALVMMAEGVGVDAYSIMRRAEQVIRGEEE